jgi:hypothetical protein
MSANFPPLRSIYGKAKGPYGAKAPRLIDWSIDMGQVATFLDRPVHDNGWSHELQFVM